MNPPFSSRSEFFLSQAIQSAFRPKLPAVAVIAVWAWVTAFSSAVADTIVVEFQNGDANGYMGCRDVNLRNPGPNTNYLDGRRVGADLGGPGQSAIHGLIKFEGIFGERDNQIPMGAVIVSARLIGYSLNSCNGPNLHRVLAEWRDDTATWNNPFVSRNRMGGIQADDIESTASHASYGPAKLPTGWRTFDITPFVQAWSDGAPNHGVAWLPTGYDAYTIVSSEYGVVAQRPKLVVEYERLATAPTVLTIHQAVELDFVTEANALYQIQVSNDMVTWKDHGSPIVGDGARHSFFERVTGERRFYRIRKSAPSP